MSSWARKAFFRAPNPSIYEGGEGRGGPNSDLIVFRTRFWRSTEEREDGPVSSLVLEQVTRAPRAVERRAVTPTRLRFSSALVVVGYLLLGIAAYGPAYAGLSRRPFIVGPDFQQSVWFLAWIPHALAHGLNPFFSSALLAPSGVNLAQNTASPLLGLLTVPLSPFLDPMARANVLLVLAMPLSASSAFIVLRKWRVSLPAAALGGFLFGFSPYMVDQNVELVFLALIPLFALVIASMSRGHGSPSRLGVQFGLLTLAQYLISPEILTVVLLFAVAGVVSVVILDRSVFVAPAAWRAFGTAAAVSAALLAYPVWMMIAGPEHFVGRPWPTINYYHSDLLSFVVPGKQQKFSLGMRSLGVRSGGPSGAAGAGGHIGILLLGIGAYLAWSSRRRLRSQIAVIILIGAAILSLGPYLAFAGRQTRIPLPFLVLDHIPLLNNILPSRICLVMFAGLAAVIAFGLDDLSARRATTERMRSRRSWKVGHLALGAGVVAGVLLATPPPQEVIENSLLSPSAASLPLAVTRAVPADDPTALTYPYATEFSLQPMQWQFNDDFRFRLLGGYAYHPNLAGGPSLAPNVMTPAALQQFLVAQNHFTWYYGGPLPLNRALVTITRLTLARYDVRLVIVDSHVIGSKPVEALFRSALGPPAVVDGPFSVWVGKGSPL